MASVSFGGGAPSPAALAALLAGQTVPGNLTVNGSLQTTGGPGSFIQSSGAMDVAGVGKGLQVAEGANAKQGVATLAAGTVVVANTSVTANSRIQLTCQALGTVVVPSGLGISARTPGTSFTILASQNTDTSIIAYEIIEPG